MSVTITTSLVAAGVPEPVQLVIDGIPSGASYVVTGVTSGSAWPVPGGVGIGTGGQVVLIDNRTALNVPVTYRVIADGQAWDSTPITVAHGADLLLQSLDGRTLVSPVALTPGDFPMELGVIAATHVVPGRSRPVVRYATGADGGSALSIITDAAGTAALRSLQRSGQPLVLRLAMPVHDLPPVDLIHVTGWSSVAVGYGTWRRWSLAYLSIDDPQPSAVLSAFTWDDFDDAMSTRTWTAFDALFAGSTWDDLDTYPWTQL